MDWYVVFKDGSEARIQTAADKDDALWLAGALSRQGRHVLCVGPFGQEDRSDQEIKGTVLRTLLLNHLQNLGAVATGSSATL
jgi:hypothetical protein